MGSLVATSLPMRSKTVCSTRSRLNGGRRLPRDRPNVFDSCFASIPLERLADLQIVVVDATGAARAIGPDALPVSDLRSKALLVRTDFWRH